MMSLEMQVFSRFFHDLSRPAPVAFDVRHLDRVLFDGPGLNPKAE